MKNDSIKRILLLVESSQENRKAIKSALDLAELMGADIVLLNVVDNMLLNRLKRISEKTQSEIEIEQEENGWKYLFFVEEMSKDRGIGTIMIQENGTVQNIVVSKARDLKADLIVLSYPRDLSGQMKRLARGHIDKIIENASCQVLIIK